MTAYGIRYTATINKNVTILIFSARRIYQ